MYRKIAIVMVAVFSISTLTGFGLGDLKDKIGPNTAKCDGKQSCKNKEKLKSAAKVAVVVGAAALIAKLVIDYNSKQTKSSEQVVKEEKLKNGKLPAQTEVRTYTASIVPGSVIKAEQDANVVTTVAVVPGRDVKKSTFQEKLEISDSTNKVLQTVTKTIPNDGKPGGNFENSFDFKFPKGVPDGQYLVKTTMIIDGKAMKTANGNFQFALQTQPDNIQVAILLP